MARIGAVAFAGVLVSACSANGVEAGCDDYASYGTFPEGTSLIVLSPIGGSAADGFEAAWRTFERCTGIEVIYDGSQVFETEVFERVTSGDVPDLAFVPSPGMLVDFAAEDAMVEPLPELEANVDANWNPSWKALGTVDGTFYAAPLGAVLKSLVWYSPTTFSAHGYEVPTTWAGMVTLSDQMVDDGIKPWCGGMESGEATGWPATDWLEQIVLREHGGDAYDRWVSHDLLFDSTEIKGSMATLDQWMRNPDWVNGGFGDSTTIATTSFLDAGAPVLTGECGMFQQASFFEGVWQEYQEGAVVAADGDVFAFYLPPIDPGVTRPAMGGGEFVVAFAERPEVQAFQAFLSSETFATLRVEQGNWVTANGAVSLDAYEDPIARLSAEVLADPDGTFRFDASDNMPWEVGAGSFWVEMTKFFAENQSIDATVQAIDASWPAP